MKKEYKTVPAFVKLIDETEGVVEAIIAVFGNIDYKQDIIRKGAFKKTITETGLAVKVLDAHNSMSVLNIIGKPLEIKEVTKKQLPDEITNEYPMATGGVYTKTQFLMDTPEGAGVFKRMKAGVIDEWSFGFMPVKFNYDKLDSEGKPDKDGTTIRIIEEIKLFEYSPVLWGANPATATISAKDEDPEITLATIHEGIQELQEAVNQITSETLPDNDSDQEKTDRAEPETDPLIEDTIDDKPELDPLTQDMFNLIEIERQKNKELSIAVERG